MNVRARAPSLTDSRAQALHHHRHQNSNATVWGLGRVWACEVHQIILTETHHVSKAKRLRIFSSPQRNQHSPIFLETCSLFYLSSSHFWEKFTRVGEIFDLPLNSTFRRQEHLSHHNKWQLTLGPGITETTGNGIRAVGQLKGAESPKSSHHSALAIVFT